MRIPHAPAPLQRYELEARDPQPLQPADWHTREPWATLERVALDALERIPPPSINDLIHSCGYIHLAADDCPDESTARAWHGDR